MVRLLALVIALSGCGLGETCKPHTTRCAGDELETCTPHGGGFYGIPPEHVEASDPTWDLSATCGDGMCIEGSTRAFCALSPAPDPACTSDGWVCDGTTRVTCRDGYPIEREACASCDGATATCTGSLHAWCEVDADCAAGLRCEAHSYGGTCEP